LSLLKYISISVVTSAILVLLIHQGAFGDKCTFYEDGSNSCNKKINKNQWDCNTMGNKICGKTTQNFQDFKEDLNIIQANEATDNPTQINEDQFIICNMWKVCQEIDSDDYMDSDALKQLWYNFDNDLDTFDIKDVTN
jgi:hypothetical protein